MLTTFRVKLITFLILFLGAGLRFYALGRTLGGGDENAMLLYFGYQPFLYIVTQYFDVNNHIFHTVLLHLMAEIFGEDNEIAIRFPNFLFGLASLWLIYKTAFIIYKKKEIALTALLIGGVCPIHIYYSQTARGYSLVVFFSISAIYCCLKILETGNFKKWAWGLIISGFLSIYTIPTSSYFVFGLAGWILCILLFTNLRNEFPILEKNSKNYWIGFTSCFLAIGFISLSVYWPVKDQVMFASKAAFSHVKTYYGETAPFSTRLILQSILQTFSLIFQESIRYFIPLVIVGAATSTIDKKSYRVLLFAILLFPLLIVYFSGVSVYPRNYIYNFPTLIIFMAAGLIVFGKWLNRIFKIKSGANLISKLLILIYVGLSLKLAFTNLYPSLHPPSGDLYKEIVRKNSKSNDLLIVKDARHYLYARTVYKDNIKTIINQNKLSGIKWIGKSFSELEQFSETDQNGNLLLFKDFFQKEKINYWQLPGNKALFDLTSENSISILPENFELVEEWQTVSGVKNIGIFNTKTTNKKTVLFLKNKNQNDLIVEKLIDKEFDIKKDSLAVLLWKGSKRFPSLTVNKFQFLSFNINNFEKFKYFRKANNKQYLRLFNVNSGMRLQLNEGGVFSQGWNPIINVLIGIAPKGRYRFGIELNASKGKVEAYSNFSLFIIEK
jgi:hypothetical protein